MWRLSATCGHSKARNAGRIPFGSEYDPFVGNRFRVNSFSFLFIRFRNYFSFLLEYRSWPSFLLNLEIALCSIRVAPRDETVSKSGICTADVLLLIAAKGSPLREMRRVGKKTGRGPEEGAEKGREGSVDR